MHFFFCDFVSWLRKNKIPLKMIYTDVEEVNHKTHDYITYIETAYPFLIFPLIVCIFFLKELLIKHFFLCT